MSSWNGNRKWTRIMETFWKKNDHYYIQWQFNVSVNLTLCCKPLNYLCGRIHTYVNIFFVMHCPTIICIPWLVKTQSSTSVFCLFYIPVPVQYGGRFNLPCAAVPDRRDLKKCFSEYSGEKLIVDYNNIKHMNTFFEYDGAIYEKTISQKKTRKYVITKLGSSQWNIILGTRRELLMV